jgi:hypothetical protein
MKKPQKPQKAPTKSAASARPDPVERLPLERMIAVLRYRGLNAEAMVAAQRRNLESLLEASETVAHGMQSITDKQMAMMRQGLTSAMSGIGQNPMAMNGNGAHDPAQAMKQVEGAVRNMSEIADLMVKCNLSAFDAVNRSMMDSVRSFYQLLNEALTRPAEK